MSDKTAILGRIKEYYDFNTDSELADFLGIQRSTLSNWTKRNTIDYDLVFSKCEQIDKNWLLTGSGSMLRESKTNHTEIQKTSGLTSSKNIDNQNENSNNNANTQENNLLITTLLERLEKQSEVIGVLKSENKQLRNQLAEKNQGNRTKFR